MVPDLLDYDVRFRASAPRCAGCRGVQGGPDGQAAGRHIVGDLMVAGVLTVGAPLLTDPAFTRRPLVLRATPGGVVHNGVTPFRPPGRA